MKNERKSRKKFASFSIFHLWMWTMTTLLGEKEGGKRCEKCFVFRLKKTAEYAKAHNFDVFATTLSVSPHKNTEVINSVGKQISQELAIEFLDESFKKKDGYLRSINLSKEMNLYRQNYCGCLFSKRD